MKRMYIFYALILVILFIVGSGLFFHYRKSRNNFQILNINQPFDQDYSKLEEGTLVKDKKIREVINTGKNFWQIYKNGIPTTDLLEDYAQALVAFPNQNRKYEVPDMVLFNSFQTKQEGPYKVVMSPLFEFEFFVILTYGGSFNLNGKNIGKYISRVSIMVPHTKIIRQNYLNLFCKVKRISTEENSNQEEIAMLSLIISARSLNIENQTNILVNGNGEVKVIFK
jgi:hypothetical protein